MSGQWKKVVQVRFRGGPYEEKALDQRALQEILKLQKVLTETAKQLWRQKHPERKILPKRFEERVNLCLRKVGAGSTCADLEVYIEKPKQGEFENWIKDREPTEAREAVILACEVFEAAEHDRLLPERMPKVLFGEYAKIGDGLGEGQRLEFGLPKAKKRVQVTARHRDRLQFFAETPYEDTVEVTGEVLEADVKMKRFQLWTDERTKVSVAFSAEQENLVTQALAEHRSVRLKVCGRGVHSPEGKLESIKEVTALRVLQVGEEEFDPNAQPIEDIIAELTKDIPPEELAKLPTDLGENLDHYLYGAPKK